MLTSSHICSVPWSYKLHTMCVPASTTWYISITPQLYTRCLLLLCVFPGGIHHVCLEVADVKQSLGALTPAGVRVLDPEPKIGAHGNPVRLAATTAVNATGKPGA